MSQKTMQAIFDYRIELQRIFHERKLRNPRYSLRSYARDLKVGIATLSQVLAGKRHLSVKNAKKVIYQLSWGPHQEMSVYKMVKKGKALQKSLVANQVLQLAQDQFEFICEWYHLPLLCLADRGNFLSDTKLIASVLGVKCDLIEQALDRLIRLKLVRIKDGNLFSTGNKLKITTNVPSCAIRKYHHQNLDLIHESLESVEMEKREVTSITFNMNPEKMMLAKKYLNKFKKKMEMLFESQCTEEVQEVFTLSLALFPAKSFKNEEEK